MPISGQQNFTVSNSPILNNEGMEGSIANINAAGYDPTDRERLFMRYNPAAGRIELNPQTNMFGRANKFGGNYNFDPTGDYLNTGMFGSPGQSPIRYGGSGLDRETSPATGAGGGVFNNNLRVGIPRMSATPNVSGGSIQCPYGFYSYGNTCVPGVNLDPTNPANVLGIGGTYTKPKGAILRVIPPPRTAAGQMFQVVTNIQNIGNKVGKFYTKVSIAELSIVEALSNSIMLQAGQQGVVFQTLQMPNPPPQGSMLQIKSDLYLQNPDNPGAPPTYEDTNQAQMPTPGTVLGMPPLQPPMPNFPVQPFPQPPPYASFSSREYKWKHKHHDHEKYNKNVKKYIKKIRKTYKHLGKDHPDHPHNISVVSLRHPFHPGHVRIGYADGPRPLISVIPQMPAYYPGMATTVATVGFIPGEPVTIQLYIVIQVGGMMRLKQKIGMKMTMAGPAGTTMPLFFRVPPLPGREIAIVAIGNMSGRRSHQRILIA